MKKYSSLDKLLHRQFLSNNSLSNYLFTRLKTKSKNVDKNNITKVFVLGLARSGTTALLNGLYGTGEFASILYKHMPFIFSPELANFFSKKIKGGEYEERYHKDRILINQNSPECLDEPFWLKACSNMYSKKSINQIDIKNQIIEIYDSMLCRYAKMQGKDKILVKNNNNLIRVNSLVQYILNAIFIILFRDPITHSFSMLNQHKNFLNLQSKDPFINEYMDLLGHFEFGNSSKCFKYTINYIHNLDRYQKTNINYWLCQWINVYSNLSKNLELLNKKNVILIPYEELCKDKNIYNSICDNLAINNNSFNFVEKKMYCEEISEIDEELRQTSYKIYNSLMNFSKP